VSGDPTIHGGRVEIAADVEFGPDVVIEADEISIGPGSRIGMSDSDDFRTAPGVRISAKRFRAGAGVAIGRAVRIDGGDIDLADTVRIVRESTIRVTGRLEIGEHGTVGEAGEISGRDIRIGQELWMLPQAKIGGGSAFETASRLEIGHYVHLGVHTLVNTARPVVIGHEVGLGTRTSIYTHGAYPSALMGYPVAFDGVEIGDFTWIPGATINPGVRIGRNCVIGVNSLVTKHIPDGSLAAGSPAAVIREAYYPRPLSGGRLTNFWLDFLGRYAALLAVDATPAPLEEDGAILLSTPELTIVAIVDEDAWSRSGRDRRDDAVRTILIGPGVADPQPANAWTAFDTRTRRVAGVADAASERLANELRRHGIRFYSRARAGHYVDWDVEVPRFEGEPLDGEVRAASSA
jgi:acetyltransferase-like isoleucine patch superfamily enzyme